MLLLCLPLWSICAFVFVCRWPGVPGHAQSTATVHEEPQQWDTDPPEEHCDSVGAWGYLHTVLLHALPSDGVGEPQCWALQSYLTNREVRSKHIYCLAERSMGLFLNTKPTEAKTTLRFTGATVNLLTKLYMKDKTSIFAFCIFVIVSKSHEKSNKTNKELIPLIDSYLSDLFFILLCHRPPFLSDPITSGQL